MVTCASCGNDVTGKKFCSQCGAPVPAVAAGGTGQAICPRCNGEVNPGAAFCMHCGTALNAQAAASQPTTRTCPACNTVVPAQNAFCTNCGQSLQQGMTPAPAPAPQRICPNCGRQNEAHVNFCAGCGAALNATAPSSGPYPVPPAQPYTQYPQPQQTYSQPQYPPQQTYSQPGYQPQPMLGQPPMVLRCPVCMAMAPMGTTNCLSCHTSLAGVVPTPANVPPGQQGGLGGFMQGDGGKYAMGALGGAAAVIGGEMLLHGVERSIEGDRGYGYGRRDEGLLGDLGNLADDVGLF